MHHQPLAGLGAGHGVAQVFQFHPDGILPRRLRQIAAGMKGIGGHSIVQIAGNKNQVDFWIALLQLFAQLNAIHAAQLNIQKRNIAGIFHCPTECCCRIGEISHLGILRHCKNALGQQVQGIRFIIYGQDLHWELPPF